MKTNITTDTEGVSLDLPKGVTIRVACPAVYARILTREALSFVADLERQFRSRRSALLAARTDVQARLDDGGTLDFLAETCARRTGVLVKSRTT